MPPNLTMMTTVEEARSAPSTTTWYCAFCNADVPWPLRSPHNCEARKAYDAERKERQRLTEERLAKIPRLVMGPDPDRCIDCGEPMPAPGRGAHACFGPPRSAPLPHLAAEEAWKRQELLKALADLGYDPKDAQ